MVISSLSRGRACTPRRTGAVVGAATGRGPDDVTAPGSISPVAPGPERILQGLNPAQREAVVAARGPLAVVAGAGTGKTTTIMRRIAYQVASGAVDAGSVLAVTFTEKAAGEMRQRLVALGVGG